MSAPNYMDLARGTRRVEGLAAFGFGTALVTLSSEAVQASQVYAWSRRWCPRTARPA
ncbi:MAG TPA: hypothetical protein VJN70_13535 [Gemmatimonadaceae bacterium]|nr:hypothetical protein [Gemmatimonadaceae bacterium]